MHVKNAINILPESLNYIVTFETKVLVVKAILLKRLRADMEFWLIWTTDNYLYFKADNKIMAYI